MERNNQNNPTGKPFCCQIGCDKDATHEIMPATGNLDDYTHSCEDHIKELTGDIEATAYLLVGKS